LFEGVVLQSEQFEWDDEKVEADIRKQQVSFFEVSAVLN
jgi:uncharacterized DUF497 family protein